MKMRYRELLRDSNPYGDDADKMKLMIKISIDLIWFILGSIMVMVISIVIMGSLLSYKPLITLMGVLLGGLLILISTLISMWRDKIMSYFFNKENMPYLFFRDRLDHIRLYLLESIGFHAKRNLKLPELTLSELNGLSHQHKDKIIEDLMENPQLASLPAIRDLYGEYLNSIREHFEESKNYEYEKLLALKNRIDNGDFLPDWIPYYFILSWLLSLVIILNIIPELIVTALFIMVVMMFYFSAIRAKKHKGYNPLIHYLYKKFDFFPIYLNIDKSDKDILRNKLRESPQLDYLWGAVMLSRYYSNDPNLIESWFGVHMDSQEDSKLKDVTLDSIRKYLPNEYEQDGQWQFSTDNLDDWGNAYMQALDGKVHHSLIRKTLSVTV